LCINNAKYLKYTDCFFIFDHFLKIAPHNLEFIGKMFLIIVENNDYIVDYKNKEIISIVEILYDNNQIALANEICNAYGKKNIDFLRETYDKHNKKGINSK